MSKYFSFLKKRKKTILLIFFFSIFAYTAFPQITSAVSWPSIFGVGVDDMMTSVFNALIGLVLVVPVFATAFLSSLAGTLLMWTLKVITAVHYTKGITAVDIGWPIVRDLANMIIVLGLIVIGVSTALRIKEYEAKQLLAKLIVAALLVNFSLLICGIIIDGTNIATNFFFTQVKSGPFATQALQQSLSDISNISGDWRTFGPKLLADAIFNFLAFFVYFLYIALLLGRIIALWILVILSPLAFVCRVFPMTKIVWDKWRSNFTQWCIIGIPAGLFYYIAAQMIKNQSAGNSTLLAFDKSFLTQGDSMISGIIETIANGVSFLIPAILLVVGFFASLQFSAAGASTITGFANKMKGQALGGGLKALQKAPGNIGKGLGWAANKLGGNNNVIGQGLGKAGGFMNKYQAGSDKVLKAGFEKTRSALGRGLEAAGAIDEGTMTIADNKRIEGKASTLSKQYARAKATGDTQTVDAIQKQAREGSGIDGAAAMKVITDAKDLNAAFAKRDSTGKVIRGKSGGMDIDAAVKKMGEAESTGAVGLRESAEKLDPNLRAYNPAIINKLMAKKRQGGQGLSKADAQKEAVAEGFRKAAPADIQNYSEDTLKSTAFIDNASSKSIFNAAKTMSGSKLEAMKGHVTYLQSQMREAANRGDHDKYDQLDKKLNEIAAL